ncbi:Hypothetical predicted protein [Paramuricea clavata]|uniref:Uncharacterized protein n=1 Tax=Paramuricea clavata TaxID=317549 RepID=A0A7D9INB9_PARCT|nr:Hypothetical predicted protein [Paramuricea clavata]
MATSLSLPLPEPLKILEGNTSIKWKKFKQKWTNYEIATGVAEKQNPTRVTTFLTVIWEETVDVYNMFTWATAGDNLKIDKVVFGILDNSVRERLLRDPELTLQTAIERVRSAELTNAQLKQIKADQKITEELPRHHVKSNSEHSYKNCEQNLLTPIVNCKCKLKCTRGGSQHILEFEVVDSDVKPLLIAETCQKLQFLQVLMNDKHDIDPVVHEDMSMNASSNISKNIPNFEGIGCLEGSFTLKLIQAQNR